MSLDQSSTALIKLSALASRPSFREELLDEVRVARTSGKVRREEIYEAFLQLYLFAGFPAALEAMRALSRSWHEPLTDAEERAEAAIGGYEIHAEEGEALYKRVYAGNADRVREEMLKLSPELAAWAVIEGYGKTLSREVLDTVTRELCVVAALTQLEWERQLFSHILGAWNVGASREAILEAAEIGSLGDTKKFLVAEQLIKKVV
jgi:4-carboxymuconolactone decarboxylase